MFASASCSPSAEVVMVPEHPLRGLGVAVGVVAHAVGDRDVAQSIVPSSGR
jgi:hypothetical protein